MQEAQGGTCRECVASALLGTVQWDHIQPLDYPMRHRLANDFGASQSHRPTMVRGSAIISAGRSASCGCQGHLLVVVLFVHLDNRDVTSPNLKDNRTCTELSILRQN
jgi:hypothetical protein